MSRSLPCNLSGLFDLSRFGTLCFPGLRKIRGEAPFFKQVRSGAVASPPCNGGTRTGLVALEWFRVLFEQVRSGAVASTPCNGEPRTGLVALEWFGALFKQVRSGAVGSPPCHGEPWTGLVALECFRMLFEQVRSGAVGSPPCNGEPGMAQVCGGKRAADDAASSNAAGSAVG